MQKRVNLVDLVKSFPTSIYLQTSASIQPRTGLSKFAKKQPKVRKKVRTNIGTRVGRFSSASCRHRSFLANRGDRVSACRQKFIVRGFCPALRADLHPGSFFFSCAFSLCISQRYLLIRFWPRPRWGERESSTDLVRGHFDFSFFKQRILNQKQVCDYWTSIIIEISTGGLA